MNLKKIAGNSLWMAISRVGMAMVKFITVPMLLSYYGKESFGVIALAFSLNAYLQILAMGLPSGIVRFVAVKLGSEDSDELGRLSGTGLTLYLLIGLLNVLILAGLGGWGIHIFNVEEQQLIVFRRLIYISAASSFFFWIGSYLDQLLTGAEEIAWNSRRQIYQVFLEFAAVLFITQSGHAFGVEMYLILSLLSLHVFIPLKIMRWRRHASLRISLIPRWDWKVFRPVFFYSGWMLLFSLFSVTAVQMRPLLLGMRAADGASSAAEYRILMGITQFVLMTYGWVATPLLPAMSKAYGEGQTNVVADVIQSMSKLVWVVLGVILFGFLACSHPLLSVYVGPQYGYLSAPLDIWLIALSISLFLGPSSVGVLTTGRVKRLAAFTGISSAISLAVMWMLAPRWGLQAAIAAVMVYNVSQFFFYGVFMIPQLIGRNAVGFVLKNFVPALLAGLVSAYVPKGLVLWLNWESPWAQLFFCGAVFSLLYIVLTGWLVCPVSEIRKRLAFLQEMSRELRSSGQEVEGRPAGRLR
jgi:O-antigen/teichoic acid export membrane protein